MNNKLEFVFKGFINLDHNEKNDLIKKINTWIESDEKNKGIIKTANENFIKKRIITGPNAIGNICPCCKR